ncbi:MAG: methyltransferase domain-containing protein [Azonexus sp.]|nr:methyltransferase domain-containing protein [Azonexus sp.]MDZ4315123.1 methyltransferase domain-containing protein [Azonexus sp.]
MNEVYSDEFYRTRQQRTQAASEIILGHLLKIIPPPTSAVDLGCGVGAWLATLRDKGICDVQGIDGPWVNRKYLAIQQSEFFEQDFTKPLNLERRFDLAMSLEVAEHLPIEVADQFVDNLTSLSDFILFSAAPPLQGGSNHINEQPIEYWQEKFNRKGYSGFDCIRPYIWHEQKIGAWYRQNVGLFVKNTRISELSLPENVPALNGYMHSEIYFKRFAEAHTVKGAWKLLRRALKKKILGDR